MGRDGELDNYKANNLRSSLIITYCESYESISVLIKYSEDLFHKNFGTGSCGKNHLIHLLNFGLGQLSIGAIIAEVPEEDISSLHPDN